MGRLNPLEGRLTKLLHEPPSVRVAAGAIVTATAMIVVGAGALIRVIDHDEYSSIWVGMWWALQTVTTVGYGDVTPENVNGRLVGAVVMLQGIAFLAIVTAAITSTFVARAQREYDAAHEAEEESDLQRIEARFDELERKIDRLEATLQSNR
jgi:voltage-gated potassium channel